MRMREATPTDTLTLLAYAIDEMHETSSLLRVYDVLRDAHRPWWRALFFAAVRTGRDMNAEMAVQYLGQNVERARDHWCEAVRLLTTLFERQSDDPLLRDTELEVTRLGFYDVLGRLTLDAIPGPRAQAAEYLGKVCQTIGACKEVVVKTRSSVMLRRMRPREA
jgi:hypothetical protein